MRRVTFLIYMHAETLVHGLKICVFRIRRTFENECKARFHTDSDASSDATIALMRKLEPYMSRLMTKPTMWLCAQRRLKSAWASVQSDQSLRCPHEESLGP